MKNSPALPAWFTSLCFAVTVGVSYVMSAQPTALVTPAWVKNHLDDPDVRLIELGSSVEAFGARHIPNAQRVDWRTELVDPSAAEYFTVAPRAEFEALLSRLGVASDTTLVLYDSQSNRLAARMFWVMRYYGHGDVRILDGGMRAWEAAGGELTAEIAAVAATDYRVTSIQESLIADLDYVANAIDKRSIAIVDARAPQFYSGEELGSQFGSDEPNAKAGHVPSAENFFWADHVTEDGTFKPVDELRAQYEGLGIVPARAVVTYCHVGLQAATPWFVLTELLGYPNVRLYDRSMAEWANAPGTELALDR